MILVIQYSKTSSNFVHNIIYQVPPKVSSILRKGSGQHVPVAAPSIYVQYIAKSFRHLGFGDILLDTRVGTDSQDSGGCQLRLQEALEGAGGEAETSPELWVSYFYFILGD